MAMSSETKRKAGDGNLMASLLLVPEVTISMTYTLGGLVVNINKNRVLEICVL